MSIVSVAVMSCMYFIGWKDISLVFMGLLFDMFGLAFTIHGSNPKSPDLPSSLNCNCDLVAHSSLPMDPFAIWMEFSTVIWSMKTKLLNF